MKNRIVLALAMLWMALSQAAPAAAQEDLFTVHSNQARMTFPTSVRFSLEVESRYPLKEAVLLYGTNARSCQDNAGRQEISFASAGKVQLDWTWDLERSGALPIGAQVWWQWELTDAKGNTWRTPRQTLDVSDPSYAWNTTGNEQITIQWVDGGAYFGNAMLDIARSGLERLVTQMGIAPDSHVLITIYPDVEGVKNALIHAAEWTGGVAFPQYNTIITGIGPREMSWARDVIPHELAHLVVGALTFNCRGVTLPTWLSEGMAVYAEGSLSESDRDRLLRALEQDDLPALTTLASGFSPYSEEAALAYAHSGAVVAYLAETYGPDKLNALLRAIQQGARADTALQNVYQMDTYELDRAWRAAWGFSGQLPARAAGPAATATPVPTLALWNPLSGVETAAPTAASTPGATAPPATEAPPTEAASPAAATPTPGGASLPADSPVPGALPAALPAFLLAGGALIALVLYRFRRHP